MAKSSSKFTLDRTNLLLIAGAVMLMAVVYFSPKAAAEKAVLLPPPSATVLAGLPPGTAAGGEAADADYARVSGGNTGHAESVQISYDPKQVSYAQLLQIFFSVAHDPTQLDRQYPDTGTQYRSAIFYKDAAQKALADGYIARFDLPKIANLKATLPVLYRAQASLVAN